MKPETLSLSLSRKKKPTSLKIQAPFEANEETQFRATVSQKQTFRILVKMTMLVSQINSNNNFITSVHNNVTRNLTVHCDYNKLCSFIQASRARFSNISRYDPATFPTRWNNGKNL